MARLLTLKPVNREALMSKTAVSQADDHEFEEVSSEEVDRIVDALDSLIESVESDNITHYLEEASSNIYYLVYEDGDDEAESSEETDTVAEVDEGVELRDAA